MSDHLSVKLFHKIFLSSKSKCVKSHVYTVTFNRVLLKARHEKNTSYKKTIFI